MADYLAANRANWDERVPIHVASQFYDVQGWMRDRPGQRGWEREILGDVAALNVAHLQCHFRLDTLALVDAGAQVAGLDFSRAAITQARSLAKQAGLDERARFVQADVYDAVEVLSPNSFDLVYVSLGALCWLPNVQRWAHQVAALLRPGGRLYLHDGHPLAWALAEDDMRIEHTYFEEPTPHAADVDVTYTDGDARMTQTRQYEWNHSIGEIVSAVIDQGLQVTLLREHDWTVWQRFPWLVATSDGRWAVPPDRPRVPLTFTLTATRPA